MPSFSFLFCFICYFSNKNSRTITQAVGGCVRMHSVVALSPGTSIYEL
jgi:hypothetical protein